MTGLAPMQLFRDVAVVPVGKVRRSVPIGGPIWHSFDAQVSARHCRDGRPSDRPAPMPVQAAMIDEPAVWGGYLIHQFGHLVAEHLTRLPQSVRDRPRDRFLFTIEPGSDVGRIPLHVWDVLDWHGVPRDRVHLVTSPVLVRELHVAAQGEMLGGVPTSPQYLDLLEERARLNGLRPVPNRLVFVTRAGMVASGRGGHAGEAYLAGLLSRLGVPVVDPGNLPIRSQLALYAGADILVFSEGSALHGRTLIGRVRQEIHVLRRRSLRNTARCQLAPRCTRLAYHQVLAGRLGCATETRGSRPDLEVALYDVEILFHVFAGLGIDLRPHWDDAAYRQAVSNDLAGWMTANPTSRKQHVENLDMLADLDLDPPPGLAADAAAAPSIH
ncbi:glycosyltransferase 61 family protein [Tabrizicola caldifontis]|uniref:glycosyltransferase 61 family protein n=1 Tax=Tabrizicola caldifontis TaxID=2528036 RepID=UPI001080283B|nr:glycosyltransferase family 61 protein [Rhodobacter sp. YIM 73028]